MPSEALQAISQIKPSGLGSLERLLKASADQLRLEILQALQHESYGVLELCALFSIKQSAMSHHLKVLSKAQLVTTRREGNAIFYRRMLPAASDYPAIVSQLFAAIDDEPRSESLQQAIDRAQTVRGEQSLKFFSENSQRFTAQQDLIVNIADYSETLNEILDTLITDAALQSARKQAVEIGPGDGSYLHHLSQRFNHVIALDNAEPMLAKCRDTASQQGIKKVGFVHGDTRTLVKLDEEIGQRSDSFGARKADCVVANMVLHHNTEPQAMIQDIAQVLASNGVFLISELCQHDQEWVREAAGDVWLGFDEMQIDQWASAAHLIKGPSSYTALRNGFRIQMLSYIKTTVKPTSP